MIYTMHPFTTFMNVESTRSYIDDLYSSDPDRCLQSIRCIKNSVIGSNRQKESVIAQGIVPRLLQLLEDKNTKLAVRVESAVTIGSLAKGTSEHIEVLINSGTIQLLLDILEENEPRLVDTCLCCLRTLSQLERNNVPNRFVPNKYDVKRLQKLLTFAGPEASLQRQSCVASILGSACKTTAEQNELCSIGTPALLASLLSIQNASVRVPVLSCLAAMCWNNANVAGIVSTTCYKDVKVVSHLANLISRDKPVEMQLEAAKCLTNLHRAGAIPASDAVITYRTLPCLVRLCQIEHSEPHRAAAAETLAYLTEVDSNLQKVAAISNQLVSALVHLLNCHSAAAKRAAFRAFASLGANDEHIRKRIIDTKCLMESVLKGFDDGDEHVRLAAVWCLHSLSRSVQQLRTTFQDHSVWRPLMALLARSPSNELLTAASSILCNLLLEFSPAKEPMLEQGVVQLLATLSMRPEPCLRLNAVWALMNLAFRAEQRVKAQILTTLGTDQIFRLLADSDPGVIMKTLGLLRNLVSPRAHTDATMTTHGAQMMQAVVLVLEGPHFPDVKEQALCILGNIADGEEAREHIMSNDDVLKKLCDYMTHPAPCLQMAAVFCINNLAIEGAGGGGNGDAASGALRRQNKLKEMGAVRILQQLLATSDSVLYERVKAALSQFKDV